MLLFNFLAEIVSPLSVLLNVDFERKLFKVQLKQIEKDELDTKELRIHVQMLLDKWDY